MTDSPQDKPKYKNEINSNIQEIQLDPEILAYFVTESNQVLKELAGVVERLENSQDAFPADLMAEFSQKIDRIMGAAKTMSLQVPDHPGFMRIGKLAELCKTLGYRAAEKKSPELLPLFTAFWSDTIEVTQNLVNAINDMWKSEQIAVSFSVVLQKRLEWLFRQVAGDDAGAVTERNKELRDILKSLGL